MPFIHINDFYINLDYIAYVEETTTEYLVFFGTPDGKTRSTVVEKAQPSAKKLMQALAKSTILGD